MINIVINLYVSSNDYHDFNKTFVDIYLRKVQAND